MRDQKYSRPPIMFLNGHSTVWNILFFFYDILFVQTIADSEITSFRMYESVTSKLMTIKTNHSWVV